MPSADTANLPRWRRQPGFFEIWFLVVFAPAAQRAWWFRYTTFSSVRGETRATLWAAAFDAHAPQPAIAVKSIRPIACYHGRSPFAVRRTPLGRGGWLFFLVTCVWSRAQRLQRAGRRWTALATGEAATAFLGTQGDPWDTQWDMLLALVGALFAQLTLARVHDRQLARLERS